MSEFVTRIQELVSSGDVSVAVHGFRELAADGILLDDVTGGVSAAIVVEEYLEAFKGPSVSFFNATVMEGRYMSYGEFRKARAVRQRSSPPIAQGRIAGQMIS
jgi:hypothetical protein